VIQIVRPVLHEFYLDIPSHLMKVNPLTMLSYALLVLRVLSNLSSLVSMDSN